MISLTDFLLNESKKMYYEHKVGDFLKLYFKEAKLAENIDKFHKTDEKSLEELKKSYQLKRKGVFSTFKSKKDGSVEMRRVEGGIVINMALVGTEGNECFLRKSIIDESKWEELYDIIKSKCENHKISDDNRFTYVRIYIDSKFTGTRLSSCTDFFYFIDEDKIIFNMYYDGGGSYEQGNKNVLNYKSGLTPTELRYINTFCKAINPSHKDIKYDNLEK